MGSFTTNKAIGQWIPEGGLLDPGEAWGITVGQNSTSISQRILKERRLFQDPRAPGLPNGVSIWST